jgi:transposase
MPCSWPGWWSSLAAARLPRFDDDRQWALLAPLLPAARTTGGRRDRPEKWDRRLVLDAIFYLVRGGIAWRALPADFPPHQTVYALFRRGCGQIVAAAGDLVVDRRVPEVETSHQLARQQVSVSRIMNLARKRDISPVEI